MLDKLLETNYRKMLECLAFSACVDYKCFNIFPGNAAVILVILVESCPIFY
jgi:hypothetical protein